MKKIASPLLVGALALLLPLLSAGPHAEPPVSATGATKTTPVPAPTASGTSSTPASATRTAPSEADNNLALRKRLAKGERLTTPNPRTLKGLAELHTQP